MKFNLLLPLIFGVFFSCSETENARLQVGSKKNTRERTISSTKEDAAYWFNGKAEITSYALKQARYGEIHEGTAVFVFVTEPFSPSLGTKSDIPREDNVQVLKLNHTRKFNTGIYPYSMMTSSFFPFKQGRESLKISATSQEWCGHTYMELMSKNGKFEVDIDSYFEGESYENQQGAKALLEDDIWTMIRIRNKDLPVGKQEMYPTMMYARLMHIPYRAYQCETSISKGENANTYTLTFPELDRTVKITYETAHPHAILNWSETYYDGFGTDRKKLTTTATKMKTIVTDYWNKHSVKDAIYRDSLNLK